MPDQQYFIRPVHVVHIDDAKIGRELVKAILDNADYPKFILHSFASIKAAEDAILPNTRQIDAVVLDLTLLESEGRDTFLHAISVFSQAPIIVLTGTVDTDLAYSLVYAGADMFLNKDMTQHYLPLFLVSAIARRNRPGVASVQASEALARLRDIQIRQTEVHESEIPQS